MNDDYKIISELTELTTPATADVLPIIDVSDTTDADSGTTKKIKIGTIVPAGGDTGKVLKKSSGDDYDTEWGDGVSVAVKGDIQTYDTAPAKLPVGTDGQLLTADSGEDTGIKWADAPVAVSVTTKGDVQTHDGTDPSRLAVGTDGHVLTADAASTNGIKWAEVSGVDVTTKGDLQTYSTESTRLAVGTNGQLLSADSSAATGLAWINSYDHWIMNETPSGNVDGSNTAYDTASNYIAGKIEVFKNGQKLTGGGADYTETDSNTVTMTEAPLTGDVITVNYLKGGVAVGDANTLDGASLSTDGTLGGNSDTDIPTEKAVKTYADTKSDASKTETLTNKTLTSPILQGNIDGWTADTDTWVYVSASTFKVEGKDVTTKFTKGTRLKFTQTTAKYAVVTASSFSTDTTVTIAVNVDHTIANAAITSPNYSYQENPQGYPDWFNFAPSISGSNFGSTAVMAGKYKLDGRTCYFRLGIALSGTGISISSTTLTLPITISSTAYGTYSIIGHGSAFNGVSTFPVHITSNGQMFFYSNTEATNIVLGNNFSSSAPFTWAATHTLHQQGFYEIA